MPKMQFGRDSPLSLPTVAAVVFAAAADFRNLTLQQLRAAHLSIKEGQVAVVLTLKVTVASGLGELAHDNFQFVASFHETHSPDEQQIESAFYWRWAERIYEGVHFEMQLLKVPPQIVPVDYAAAHVHQNPLSNLVYVCYVPQLDTLEAALTTFRYWCVGTVFWIEQRQDFGRHLVEQGANFLQFMKDHFGIEIQSEESI